MDLLAAVQGCTFDDFLLAPQLQRRRSARSGDASICRAG